MKHLGDITKIDGSKITPVDVITFGSPCQDLSVAGKREGLSGERSGLFMEAVRIIKEMRNVASELSVRGSTEPVRPRYVVWENVPGAFHSGKPKGEDFRIILEEISKIADPNAVIPRPPKEKWSNSGCIMGDGWSVAWRLHDSQFWGVPQRRKRVALVADFGGDTAPKILFECKSVQRNTDPSEEKGEGTPEDAGGCVASADSKVYDARGNGNGMIAPTITGDHQNRITDYTAIVLEGNGSRPSHKGDGYSESNVCYTINSVERHGICYGLDRASYNQGKNAKYNFSVEEEKIAAQVAKGPGAVCAPFEKENVVRRLTPLEIERLQGFPDGWTDIGEWVDSNGKVHKDADSPRYRALGNSIALPFWEWLAGRIVNHLNVPDPKMGSLFDGIGGFPLVFSRKGCKPIWASEIEEFPIAVTKRRFPDGD